MDSKKRLKMMTATLLGFACAISIGGALSADDMASSSECINCHTNLEEMDRYGAAAASSSAGIAG